MKDKDGKVIYVGKAKNLKNRVNSYFARANDLSVAKRQMVAKISDIETITCQTEIEALVLETNLIKHLTPKYNILMKDDKDLAYIKITKWPIPEVIKTRQKIPDGWEYFGPYTSAVESSVRDLKRIFRVRNCRVRFGLGGVNEGLTITDKAGRGIPCIDYYIGLCPWPCLLKNENILLHEKNVDLLRNFLKGDIHKTIERLEVEMREKSKEMKFEEAAKIRDTLISLRNLHEKQNVRDIVEGSYDVFIMYEKYGKTYIWFSEIRDSQVVGVYRYEIHIWVDEYEDILGHVLVERYSSQYTPKILLLEREPRDESLIHFLTDHRVWVEVPKIGPKKKLLDFTLHQIREYAYKQEMLTLGNKTLTRENMISVLQHLGYPIPPKKEEIVFECYDISHTDGHFTYASRVVIVNGKPDTGRYKKYKIKTLQDGEIDDFASHQEVMKRRVVEAIEPNNLPHLIIIDGGKGQLSSAISGLEDWVNSITSLDSSLQTSNIPICSIAKREEEVFLPNKKDPVLFEKWTPELMVLQKARDEAHRFSINANKSARMKSMKKNILEEIPWIWPVTRKKLLKLAGSVDGIKDLYPEELSDICTVSQIGALRDHGIIS